jgi:hypothetical protein
MYSISIDDGVSTLSEFGDWRIRIRNALDHRRRISRWWSTCSMRVWLSRNGSILGVMALGSITEAELLTAFGSRWSVTLRHISPEALDDELYAALGPEMIMSDDFGHARYQPRQMTVRPRRTRISPNRPVPLCIPDPFDEPMPVLIS